MIRLRIVGRKGEIAGLNVKIKREHGLYQAVRNIHIKPDIRSFLSKNTILSTMDSHGLNGQQRNDNITEERRLVHVRHVFLTEYTECLGASMGFRRAGNCKTDRTPSIIDRFRFCERIIIFRSSYLHILNNAGVIWNQFIINTFRIHIRQRLFPLARINVVVENHKQIGLICVLLFRLQVSIGHPGLDGHTARAIRNIRQMGGIYIGRYVCATCGGGSLCRCVLTAGGNINDIDSIPKVPQDRIILAARHQVQLIKALYTVCPFIGRKRRV